jgi:hypothetical protein
MDNTQRSESGTEKVEPTSTSHPWKVLSKWLTTTGGIATSITAVTTLSGLIIAAVAHLSQAGHTDKPAASPSQSSQHQVLASPDSPPTNPFSVPPGTQLTKYTVQIAANNGIVFSDTPAKPDDFGDPNNDLEFDDVFAPSIYTTGNLAVLQSNSISYENCEKDTLYIDVDQGPFYDPGTTLCFTKPGIVAAATITAEQLNSDTVNYIQVSVIVWKGPQSS